MGDTGYPAYSRHSFIPVALFSGAEWDPDGAQPAYWIDGFGMVHLRGRVTFPAGVAGLPQFFGAVPTPFNSDAETFTVGGSSGLVLLQITPNPPGVAALNYYIGPLDPGVWLDLSGITYPAA